ncbi:MAG TPA: phosphate ABC transporter permease subunit PstC, partial [Verrucomicrobiae bacterium]|nr:phosphate ABC transporter permease subunit PstC [Verrucomicrobiae bacterium]
SPASLRFSLKLKPVRIQRISSQFIVRNASLLAAAACFALIFLMLVFLAAYAWPAIRFNGIGFFTGTEWNIGNQYGSGIVTRNGLSAQAGATFGALVFIFGTVATACLTMLFAVPLAILVALALVYRVHNNIRPLANALVELMAGVPSVVYGLWGMVVLVPWIGNTLGPFVAEHFGFVPLLGGGAGSGNGLLAATFILVLMVTPIMVATVRDVVQAQSGLIFEASMALGSTTWQAVIKAVIPSVRTGILGSVLIAFGRALGETMAVLMVCGAAINSFPHNIFQPVNTIAAVIVSQLESALTDSSGMAQRSLAELAVALFVITLTVNIVARAILRGTDRDGSRA